MRRPVLWLAALVLGVGCAGPPGAPPRRPAAIEGWPAVAGSLTARLDAGSANVCNRGGDQCLDILIEEMQHRLDRLVDTCDHRAPFAVAYLAVTKGVRDASRATDPASADYLRHLDAIFARMYFEATEAWTAARPAAVPAAWRRAFDAADRHQITGLGDLLAAMNAHITRDLAFSVADVGLTLADGTSAKPAFDQVNAVMGAAQGPMMAELARRFDPSIAQADLSWVPPASSTIGQLLAAWREESWTSAGRLVAATAADRPAVEASIDLQADTRGLAIVLGTQFLPFVTSTATRDQFCLANGHR